MAKATKPKKPKPTAGAEPGTIYSLDGISIPCEKPGK